MNHEPAMILLFWRVVFFSEDLEYFFWFTIGEGAHPGGHIGGGKVRGEPGQALLKAPIVNAYLPGQQLYEVAGVVAIGRQAPLREQADLLDRQVVDFNIRAEQK